MAVRLVRGVASTSGQSGERAPRKSTQPRHVPGQLIVRFKTAAVQHVAALALPRRASARAVAAAMPEHVAGPLALLRNAAGMQSLKPLFVPHTAAKPARAIMAEMSIHRALGRSATEVPREALSGYQLVEVKEKQVNAALLKRLRSSDAIELVEPVPNRWPSAVLDPFINRQWGLKAIGWFDRKLPNAAAVHVAILDSGVDSGHPDLRDSIEEYRHDGNAERDFMGHGTHVAGTIAAVVNNSFGLAGVANCRLHCWKIFNDPPPRRSEGKFNFEFYSAALASALVTDIKVLNLSIGGTESSKAEADAFDALRAAGVVVAAAMGNEFEDEDDPNPKEYPAGYGNVLGVGAVDDRDERGSFSNTGAHISLVAPGVGIVSTVPRVKASFADRTDYDSWDGTSMATPHVAGAAALLYAKITRSKAAGEKIMKRLTSTTKKLPGMKKRAFTRAFGSGLLDVAAALKRGGRKKQKKRARKRG